LRVEVLLSSTVDTLQEQINNFLSTISDKTVRDIKFICDSDPEAYYLYAMVLYE